MKHNYSTMTHSIKTGYREINMLLPVLLVRSGRDEKRRRGYRESVRIFFARVDGRTEYGSSAFSPLEAVKFEKKKGAMLG